MSEDEKAELLAEAKRRYPPGTIHNGQQGGNYKVVGPLNIDRNGYMYSENQSGCIRHKDGTWATVISLPPGYIPNTNDEYILI